MSQLSKLQLFFCSSRSTISLSAWLTPLVQRVGVKGNSFSTQPDEQYKNIEVKRIDRVKMVALNRPQHRNAVNHQTAKELYCAFRLFDSDDSLDVAVLYGKGGTFCAGYDLKELANVNAKDGSMKFDEFLQDCAVETDLGPMVIVLAILHNITM